MRTIYDGVVSVNTNHDGEYTNTKPRLIKFGDHTIHVRSWTDGLQKACDKIAEENPDCFHLVLDRIGWERRPYFARDIDNSYERPYQVGTTGISVECNLAANNTKELLDAIVFLFGYGKLDVELW